MAIPSSSLSINTGFPQTPPSPPEGVNSRPSPAQVTRMIYASFQGRQLDNPKLSNYHFFKIICNFPELLLGREAQLESKTREFFNEAARDYHNEKLLRRAAKISNLILQNPLLKACVTTPLTQSKLVSSEGTSLETPTYEWAAKIPFLRPLLLGNFTQKHNEESWALTPFTFNILTDFIQGNPLPKLDAEELIKVLHNARPLGYKEFLEAIYANLHSQIDEKNVFTIL